MAKSKQQPAQPAPDPHFTLKRGDKEDKIFMSYALLNRLSRACPDVEKLIGIVAFPEVQDEMLRQLLAPVEEVELDGKKVKRQLPDKFDMERDTEGVTPEHIQELVVWAVGHLMGFFIGLMNKNLDQGAVTRKIIDEIRVRAEQMMPDAQTASPNGSNN